MVRMGTTKYGSTVDWHEMTEQGDYTVINVPQFSSTFYTNLLKLLIDSKIIVNTPTPEETAAGIAVPLARDVRDIQDDSAIRPTTDTEYWDQVLGIYKDKLVHVNFKDLSALDLKKMSEQKNIDTSDLNITPANEREVRQRLISKLEKYYHSDDAPYVMSQSQPVQVEGLYDVNSDQVDALDKEAVIGILQYEFKRSLDSSREGHEKTKEEYRVFTELEEDTKKPEVYKFDPETSSIYLPRHGFKNGTKIRFEVSGGELPAGLLEGQDYYIVNRRYNSFQVASMLNGEIVIGSTTTPRDLHVSGMLDVTGDIRASTATFYTLHVSSIVGNSPITVLSPMIFNDPVVLTKGNVIFSTTVAYNNTDIIPSSYTYQLVTGAVPGGVLLISTPEIANGTYIGQIVKLEGAPGSTNAHSLNIQDNRANAGANVWLANKLSMIINEGDVIQFHWNGSMWVEDFRSMNYVSPGP